jgi:rhamnogalacturonan endolyase
MKTNNIMRSVGITFLLVTGLLAANQAQAAFGLTTTTDFYTVDTGAGLVFSVRRTDSGSSTQSAGDISSLKWNGVECQDQSRGSQVNSGFDYLYSGVSAVTVSATTVGSTYIKITVQAGNLTHYYMARSGYPHIYMGTYFTTEPETEALCRYILRLSTSVLPNGPTPSDIRNTVSTVESSDVFALSNGQTRSKHYSNMRLKASASGSCGITMKATRAAPFSAVCSTNAAATRKSPISSTTAKAKPRPSAPAF